MAKKSSLFSFLGIKKARVDQTEAEPRRPRKIWPSDEDRGRHWYAELDINRKAKEFIRRKHNDMEEAKDEA